MFPTNNGFNTNTNTSSTNTNTSSPIPLNVRPLAVVDNPAQNHVGSNHASVPSQSNLSNGAPPQENSLNSDAKRMQDELQKIGSKVKHHENNLKFLKTLKYKLDDTILDLQVSLGKYVTATAPKIEEDSNHHVRSEEEMVEKILKHEKSAAGIFYQLQSRHGSLLLNIPFSQDIVGAVAVLGKVDDDNLSRLLSEYLGLETMLGLVCKRYESVKALETYDSEGLLNKESGIHGLGASVGRTLEGRFHVICLDRLRPYAGDILADDPQRRLDIPKPRMPNGDIPAGFLGFAVNMIHVDRTHLHCLTSTGGGLRETLFYNLFSRLQVYQTKAEMLNALPCISDGAVSLDGGMMKSTGTFTIGSSNDVDVTFPKCSNALKLPEIFYETENLLKQKRWEVQRVQDDMRREHALLNQEQQNFRSKKEELLRFIADSSAYLSQHQMQTPARER